MSRRRADRLLVGALWGAACTSGLILLAIVTFTVSEAVDVLSKQGLARFITDPSWHPTSGLFGMGPMIAASIVSSVLAVAIAAPAGIAIAAAEQFYLAPRWTGLLRRAMEVLSGTPSVVIGLWGLVVLVPLFATVKPPGTSLFAAAVVLAMMLVPTIALLASIAFERAGSDLRQSALALGLSRKTRVMKVAMPLAATGIWGAVVLAIARAIGETMMVLMVAGNVVNWPKSLSEPVRTLTANMALEMAYAEGQHRSALFLSGVAVMITALALVLVGSKFGENSLEKRG